MTREEKLEAYLTRHHMFEHGNPEYIRGIKVGVEWADANPCMPPIRVVNITERSRDEIQKLLANWKGNITVGSDISLSPWISVEDRLPDDGVLVIVAYRWILGEILYASDAYHIDYGWESYDDIVAWMSIPELPKEEKK